MGTTSLPGNPLDTSSRSARCIDLAGLARTDLSRVRLAVDAKARHVTVRRGHERLFVVDTRNFHVSAVR